MKKFLIVLLAVVCLTGIVRGQVSRPVGDTIMGPDNDIYFGMFDWLDTNRLPGVEWEWNTTHYFPALNLHRTHADISPDFPMDEYWSNLVNRQMCAGNGVYGNELYTDRPLRVVGICAAAYAQPAADTTIDEGVYMLGFPEVFAEEWFIRNTLDERLESRVTDSLILYKLTEDGPKWLASGPWRAEDPHRSILLKDSTWLNRRWGMFGTNSTDSIVPLYEVTFKGPIIVTDSFMVAGTALNNQTSRVLVELPHSAPCYSDSLDLWQVRPTRYWGLANDFTYPRAYFDSLGPMGTWIKFAWDTSRYYVCHGVPDALELQTVGFWTYMIFPIIDTTFDSLVCDLVSSVRTAEITDTSVTLMWNGGNNVEWEVRHKKLGGGDVVVATTTAPTYTITGLEPNTSYYVWVRARCDSLHEFGPWSDVDTVTTQQGQATEKIDNLDRYTQLMPNPAGSVVNVTSSFGLRRIVVYDLQGHAVLEHKCSGTSATFSVTGLAEGVYVVALHTPYGMATKRLVVQR